MRFTHKDVPRYFKVPGGRWLIPSIGSLLCLPLMKGVTRGAVYQFLIWTAIGQIVYFSYGYWHSKRKIQRTDRNSVSTAAPSELSSNRLEVPIPADQEMQSVCDTVFTIA